MKLMLITLKAICSKTTESALYTHMQTLCNMCNLVVLRLGKIKIMQSIYSQRYHAGKSTHKPASPYSCYDTTLGHDTARLQTLFHVCTNIPQWSTPPPACPCVLIHPSSHIVGWRPATLLPVNTISRLNKPSKLSGIIAGNYDKPVANPHNIMLSCIVLMDDSLPQLVSVCL